MCALRAEQKRVCEVDRGGGGGRDVQLFHQDFTDRQMHQATAEKKLKNIEKKTLKGMKEGLLPVAYIPLDMPALAFIWVLAYSMMAILQT